MKGRAAKVGITSQLAAVSTKAWRRPSRRVALRVVSISITPVNRLRPAAAANTSQSGLPTTASAIAGSVIATASVASRMPTMNRIGRKFNTPRAPPSAPRPPGAAAGVGIAQLAGDVQRAGRATVRRDRAGQRDGHGAGRRILYPAPMAPGGPSESARARRRSAPLPFAGDGLGRGPAAHSAQGSGVVHGPRYLDTHGALTHPRRGRFVEQVRRRRGKGICGSRREAMTKRNIISALTT